MTYIAYVNVQYYHGKQHDENGNLYYVPSKIWMIVANILISHIYAAHPMVVFIHNSWNPLMNFTLFPPESFYMDLALLVNSWYPPKTF